ncbi:LysE family translocator [uncultured Bartonella sp.]|uniref:LysE family translocator n=1 Tax=uncultured Bartonella sp. TaxID=104108 RepID=UPI002613C376|nr:LysE family translocator [uncultured Bartonella sp.]
MHAYLVEWSTLMVVFAIAAITPGADFALILRQSLVYGRQNAFVTSFGIGLALLFHVSYTILGLGLLISKSLIAFNIVKWLGVSYLLYIGIKSVTSRSIAGSTKENQKRSKTRQTMKKAFLAGFTVNILNPKAVFFFLSIFSTLVAPATPMAVKFLYGLSMSTILVGWFLLVSIFMTTPAIRSLYQRAAKWIDRLCGAIFIALSVRLMFQKAS